MNRIDTIFKRLKRQKRKALIGYVTAGFPLLEIGVPFSDPIADGPTIQYSSQIGLANGASLHGILKSVHELRRRGVALPLILMSYCNPIYAMGIDRFFQAAKSSGVDGLIVPDLIIEEGAMFEKASKRAGVHLIYLVAPTTPKNRVKAIIKKTQGFLYAVSVTGVTGVRKAIPGDVGRFLKSIKTASPKPVAVGFGVTTPQQAREVSRFADGVIVGSALIRAIEKSKGSAFKGAARYVRSLKGAIHAS